MCDKSFQIYGVYIPRKCIDSRNFYSCLSPLKTHSPRQHFFENLFPPTAQRDGGNYDLLYRNSLRKYEDDLKH